MKTSSRFEFHLCFTEPHGNEVIGFDVYHSWKCDALWNSVAERERGGTRFDELVLKVESNLVVEDEESDWFDAPMFRLRWTRDQKAIVLRRGGDRMRVRVARSGSGGNWHWEVYLVPFNEQAYVLNWLRRRTGGSVTQWDNEFRATVWERRGSIRPEHLREFTKSVISAAVRADRAGKATNP